MAKLKPKTDDELLDDVDALSSGTYLSARDVQDGDLTCAITATAIETFKPKEGEKPQKPKLVLTLDGEPTRKLSLNDVNRGVLRDAWGKNARAWVGRVFVAFLDRTVRNPSGVKTGGLRVRVPQLEKVAAVPTAKPNGSETAAIDTSDDSIPF